MRWGLALLIVGCSAPPRLVDDTTVPTNAPKAISPEEFTTRVSGLRATLARGGTVLDVGPVFDSCEGHDQRKGCVRCEVASAADTVGLDPDMIDAVAIAFARYPDRALRRMRLEHVALCRSIRYVESDERPPAGVAIPAQRRVLLGIEYFRDDQVRDGFTIEQVVHHELFHILDASTVGDTDHDPEWLATNPRGFAYGVTDEGAPRPAGFVNRYATIDQEEDRASTFEFLMGQPEALCELAARDPIVRSKVTIVWNRVAKLIGPDVLARAAPCVDWIKPRKRATPAKRTKPIDLWAPTRRP